MFRFYFIITATQVCTLCAIYAPSLHSMSYCGPEFIGLKKVTVCTHSVALPLSHHVLLVPLTVHILQLPAHFVHKGSELLGARCQLLSSTVILSLGIHRALQLSADLHQRQPQVLPLQPQLFRLLRDELGSSG